MSSNSIICSVHCNGHRFEDPLEKQDRLHIQKTWRTVAGYVVLAAAIALAAAAITIGSPLVAGGALLIFKSMTWMPLILGVSLLISFPLVGVAIKIIKSASFLKQEIENLEPLCEIMRERTAIEDRELIIEIIKSQNPSDTDTQITLKTNEIFKGSCQKDLNILCAKFQYERRRIEDKIKKLNEIQSSPEIAEVLTKSDEDNQRSQVVHPLLIKEDHLFPALFRASLYAQAITNPTFKKIDPTKYGEFFKCSLLSRLSQRLQKKENFCFTTNEGFKMDLDMLDRNYLMPLQNAINGKNDEEFSELIVDFYDSVTQKGPDFSGNPRFFNKHTYEFLKQYVEIRGASTTIEDFMSFISSKGINPKDYCNHIYRNLREQFEFIYNFKDLSKSIADQIDIIPLIVNICDLLEKIAFLPNHSSQFGVLETTETGLRKFHKNNGEELSTDSPLFKDLLESIKQFQQNPDLFPSFLECMEKIRVFLHSDEPASPLISGSRSGSALPRPTPASSGMALSMS